MPGSQGSLAALRTAAQLVALQAAWWLFKALLSAAAVAIGAWIAYDFISSGVPGAFIPAIMVFCAGLLIAVAPWVLLGYREERRPDPRTAALAVMAAGVVALAVGEGYINTPYVIENCELRRSVFGCEFFNWLFRLAGNWAVVGAIMAVAALFIGAGVHLLIKALRS